MREIEIRNVRPEDHQRVISVIPEWWNGRDLRGAVLKVFFRHFSNTSFIAEYEGQMIGFLVGFLSQTYANEAYIHFAGVHPHARKSGVARRLYQSFYDICEKNSRTIVRSCTSPVNKLSIGFHQRMGFSIEPGDSVVEGIAAVKGYLSENAPMVVFKKELS